MTCADDKDKASRPEAAACGVAPEDGGIRSDGKQDDRPEGGGAENLRSGDDRADDKGRQSGDHKKAGGHAASDPEATASAEEAPLSNFKLRRILYPVIIGLGVVVWLFLREFDPKVFDGIHFTAGTVFWLFVAVLCMFGRDIGYIIRIKVLSGGELSWRQAFRVIMLWEFTSAVTPSAVGGTSVAILFVHKEGLSVGRSSAIVMLTSFLDELYFAVMFPLVLLLAGMAGLFDIPGTEGWLGTGLITFAFLGYGLKLAYLLVLSYGLFINPRGLKWLLMKIFKLRPLRRWYRSVNVVGTDIINSSREIKRSSASFWLKAGASTFLSWTSRYFVANALIVAFFSVSDHLLLFARQLVMWIMMLIMPTPGGSGFAEVIFSTYCADLIEVDPALQLSAAAMIAFLWRCVTYYPYLLAGAFIIPKWIGRKFGKNKQ